VTILPFCHLEHCYLEKNVSVGPFAHVRGHSILKQGASVGNFVEVKNAEIGQGAKVSHLSYIGDARIGAEANIGAGTITCNYDGFRKNFTEIGARAFIGSNTSLVAPVSVGDGVITGAGSTITEDVPADAVAVGRAPLQIRAGAAPRLRMRLKTLSGKT
jgi:bifunctional UDP-N-acetylglucosamine pyrophosphorylase/glucosamine-1-phosphate N-acetyltransferase